MHPLLKEVAFDVAYRGATEPQTLDVRLELSGPSELPLAPWAIGGFVSSINSGLCGSSDFPPQSGRAALESGPTGLGDEAPDELGPSYAFKLMVAGVSPLALRVLVEQLAGCGHPNRLKSVSIVGSLFPDGSKLSVRERELAAWLNEPASYPKAWADPGFPVTVKPVPRGATVKVTLARGDVEPVATELEETISTWQTALLGHQNAKRNGRGVADPHATFARGRRELHAKLELFDHDREPARAALVNALARFHVAVAPIGAVALGLP